MTKNISLRLQIVLIVSFLCIAVFSVSYLYSATAIYSGFSKIELSDAQVNLSRVEDSIKAQHESMINKLGDWAQWDDCYNYIKDRNKVFEKANLQSTLTLSKFNLYTFWSLDKKLVWGTNLNLKTEKEEEKLFPMSKTDIEIIGKIDYLHQFKDFKDKRFLFVNLASGPYILVSVPITTTDGKAAVNGKIITGVKLDNDYFLSMGHQLHLEIESYNLKPDVIPSDRLEVLKTLHDQKNYIDTKQHAQLFAYGLIKDYNLQNLVLYKLIIPRDIHIQSHTTLDVFLITMILTAILLVVMMVFVIEKLVLSKLSKLLIVINQVIATGDLKHKVPDLGAGEIGLLAKSFNEMINEIDKLKTKNIQNEKMVSLGKMAGSISHEINNPMEIISGRVANIRLKRENNKLTDEYLVQSLDSFDKMVERVSKIIRGLRIISRTADADPFLEKDVKELITETLEYCEARFKQEAVTLKLDINDAGTIRCREVQISQVLINLLGNSVDAIQGLPERWIEIKTERVKGKLVISVTDSGRGISKEVAEKIMTPFFTTKDVGKGTGLGLSISKGMIEDHGGTLILNTNSQYTQFVIEFPESGDISL